MPAKKPNRKPRVSITIDKKLLEWLDSEIEAFRFSSRSHGIEFCVRTCMKMEEKHDS